MVLKKRAGKCFLAICLSIFFPASGFAQSQHVTYTCPGPAYCVVPNSNIKMNPGTQITVQYITYTCPGPTYCVVPNTNIRMNPGTQVAVPYQSTAPLYGGYIGGVPPVVGYGTIGPNGCVGVYCSRLTRSFTFG